MTALNLTFVLRDETNNHIRFKFQVLMMVLPFLMIMVLPKLINTADPETQRVRNVDILSY